MDALLGALAKEDIGKHFPDSDPAYKDADSLLLLKKVMEMVRQEDYMINNLDATIVAERPKLSPYIPDMKEKLAEVLDVRPDRLNIKATTTEGMGFCGRNEGMEAYSVVTLVKPGV
jgi:2-C-methyl-D-erythritol 2,4-cyclodiphosphate synthase